MTFEQAYAELDGIAELESGWEADGDADVPSLYCIEWVRRLISRLPELGIAAPRLYPTHDGNILAEWEHDNLYISATTNEAMRRIFFIVIDADKGKQDFICAFNPDAP